MYVAGNLLLYYEEGNRAASVAPDVFVVYGIAKGARRTYKLWEEGRAPSVVIEFTSQSTRLEDLGNKRYLYASLGVREYFLCDPLGEYLDPPLQGYTLVDGEYVRLVAAIAECYARTHSTTITFLYGFCTTRCRPPRYILATPEHARTEEAAQ